MAQRRVVGMVKVVAWRSRRQGFTLVVTLSLMVLLTVISVGMLGLASVTLRGSVQSQARAVARANARLAVMLALGELQEYAGPDQRVTARADITGADVANSRLTGVWKGWEIKATEPPAPHDFSRQARDARFQTWLVSNADYQATQSILYPRKLPEHAVTLLGKGTLGDAADSKEWVYAGKVPLAAGTGLSNRADPRGALAWAVLDEGIKARIDTRYHDTADTVARQTMELGSGVRPGAEFMPGLKRLERCYFATSASESATIDKGVSRRNFGLVAEALAEGSGHELPPLTHDFTVSSVGLFTDVAHGGLKQDMHSLLNLSQLPSVYQNKGVYSSLLGLNVADVPGEPSWQALWEYGRLYRDRIRDSGGPLIKAQTPAGWQAVTGSDQLNRAAPPGVLLLPTVAKIQILFSLVGRDLYGGLPNQEIQRQLEPAEKAAGIHGSQDAHFRGTKYDYDLHLMYAPIVTLHNPYNVALEFTEMHIDFVHVPFSLQVYRNGQPQSSGLVPLDTMYIWNEQGQSPKTFGINLKAADATGMPGSTTFQMQPGEVKIFSPAINPNLTYINRGSFWDVFIGNNLTANLDAIPGWRGNGLGYDCDWLAGGQKIDGVAENGHWESCYGLAWDDKIHVEFAPLSLPSVNRFVVKVWAKTATAATVVNAIEMDYESADGLKNFMERSGVKMPMRYPPESATPNYLLGWQLIDRAEVPLRSLTHVKPFALLSVQGKTTSGGRDKMMENGRLATKPWCFAHANIGASSIKVTSEHLANASHEFDLQLLDNGSDYLLPVEPQGSSYFISGHTSDAGSKFGGQYEIPLAPIQTLAGFNSANPGGMSGYLPRFAQPIGNSWAHPLMAPEKMLVANHDANLNGGGNYLDHSFLLNLALYDRFYFSGMADQVGEFCGTSLTGEKLAKDFAEGKPLQDLRLLLHLPDGRPASQLSNEVAKPESYNRLAAWQLMAGAYNINSTSVAAWKAMLASIHDKHALYNQINKGAGGSVLKRLPATADGEKVRISRLRLPASVSEADGGESADSYWLGPREYSDVELEKLATNIVKQVRLRGPFLSMADFVNRELGAEADEKAERGALQQAIDDSQLNEAVAANAGQSGAGFEIPAAATADYQYGNRTAGAGASYQGAPGYLTQADVLNVLGNAAAARSDTFTIRGYGEARDGYGGIIACATCEVVVQRYPEWIDPADPVETAPGELRSQANRKFGRRFVITSWRWLHPKEI